jgi:hypothetical protein
MTNNKQQTAMKLYTEEQVKKMLDLARFTYNSEDKILLSQTPIELPTDEEIKKEFDVDEFDPYDLAYLGGAIWMRNKIQGGEQ